MLYLYSNRPSNGLKNLGESDGFSRIKRENSKFKARPWKTVINWGCSVLPGYLIGCRILNSPESIIRVSNKLEFFRHVSGDGGPRVVPWTTDQEVAKSWQREGHTVVARKVLTGHSGHGIIIYEEGQEIEPAPLYTKYIKKDSEFRLHFVGTDHIDTQKKIRDPDREPVNWKVRSHENGFIFVRNGFEIPEDVIKQGGRAFGVSGLDFGAVDVIYNRHSATAYVLEINSAPGLEGQTVENYAEAFKNHYN